MGKSIRELVVDQIKADREAKETGKPVIQPDAQGRLPMNEAVTKLTREENQAIREMMIALKDFIDYHDDPNMPMKELVSRAEKAMDYAQIFN